MRKLFFLLRAYCTSTIKYANLILWKWDFQSILKYLSKFVFEEYDDFTRCMILYKMMKCIVELSALLEEYVLQYIDSLMLQRYISYPHHAEREYLILSHYKGVSHALML